jgi:hypothetical protein
MKALALRRLLPTAIAALLSVPLFAEAPKLTFPQPSPASSVKQRVGFTDVQIDYSRPGVKGRDVFVDLAPSGAVWRTGANAATKVSFSTALKFGGVEVPAGTYALFSIPGADEWTVILNNVTGQWGSYTYDEKNDVARAKVKPVKLAEPVETFTIDLNDIRDDSATLNLIWQKTRVPVLLQFDVVPAMVKKIEAAMAATEKPSAGVYDQAAMFYLEHDLDLNRAAEWIAAATAQQPDGFWLFYHQARILAKKGDKAGAIAAARHSIEVATQQNGVAKVEYTRLNERLIAGLSQ